MYVGRACAAMEKDPLTMSDWTFLPLQSGGDVGSSVSTSHGRKRHACDVCHYSSNHPRNLKRHKLVHSGEKPHKCNICDYVCRHFFSLKIHKLVHSCENKPYNCDICD